MPVFNTCFKRSALLISAIAAISTIVACGANSDQTADISGTGQAVISGPISGFGSIIVNGVHFNTDDANINIDEVHGRTQQDLHVGQWVTILATMNDDGEATAKSVEYDETLKGRITAISSDTLSKTTRLTALDQIIIVDALTIVDSDDGLAVGDIIAVSGIYDAEGQLHASYIAETLDIESEIQGNISDLNENTFQINGLTIDYRVAHIEVEEKLKNGLFVEAEGLFFNNVLIANSVQQEALADEFSTNLRAEIEGLVTSIDKAANSFNIQGITVRYDNNTEFSDGELDMLDVNTEVEVEGHINASGQLIADSIEFELTDTDEIKGLVEAIDTTLNTVTIDGIHYWVTIETIISDESSAELQLFSIQDIRLGDFLVIQTTLNQIAVVLTREDKE